MGPLINMPGWFFVTLSPQIFVTALSSDMDGFAGFASREMIGCPITKFLADKTVYEMPHIMDTVKENGKWEGEIFCLDRSGREIPAKSNLVVLSDNENRDMGYLLLLRRNEMRDSNGNDFGSVYAEVGSRLRDLVHDLNNPLAVVMGSTQLLTLSSHCTGKMRVDIEKLYSELEKVVRVVEKLHRYAFSLCEKASDSLPEEKTVQHSVEF